MALRRGHQVGPGTPRGKSAFFANIANLLTYSTGPCIKRNALRRHCEPNSCCLGAERLYPLLTDYLKTVNVIAKAQRRSNLNPTSGRLLRSARNDMPMCGFEIVSNCIAPFLNRRGRLRQYHIRNAWGSTLNSKVVPLR